MLPHLLKADLCQEAGGMHQRRARERVRVLGTGSISAGNPTSSVMGELYSHGMAVQAAP